MSQTHLDKLLKSLKLSLDGRLVRALHERMLSAGETKVQFEEFQQALMEKTLRKLRKQLET